MGNAPDTTAPQHNRRRIRRWIVLAVALALAIWFGRFAYLRITLRPTPRPDYWQGRLAELDPAPSGALTAGETLQVLSSWSVESAGQGRDTREVYAGDGFRRARAALLESLREAWPRGLARQADSRRIDFEFLCLHWAKALMHHARLAYQADWGPGVRQISQSDVSTMAEDWKAVLRLVRQLMGERRDESIMAAAEIEEELAHYMNAVASQGFEELNVLALAAEVDANRMRVERPSQYFEGERLALHAQLEEIYVREGGDWLDVSAAVANRWYGAWATGTPVPSRVWNLTSPLFYTLDEARARIDRLFDYLDHLERPGDRQALPLELNPTLLNGGIWFNPQDAGTALAQLYASHTAMDAALTMLALRAYHDRNNRYPDALGQLVPDYLPRLPIDYTTGKPLHYNRAAEEYYLHGIPLPRPSVFTPGSPTVGNGDSTPDEPPSRRRFEETVP